MNKALFGSLAAGVTALGSSLAWLRQLYRRDIRARHHADRPWSQYAPVLPAEGEPLRVAMFLWGSRGDMQPLVVLGQHLKADGHTILINVRPANRHAAESLGLEEAEMFTPAEDDRPEDVLTPLLHDKPGPVLFYQLFRHIAAYIPAFVRQLEQMVDRSEANVIVVNELASRVGQIVAERRRLPLFILRYSPILVPTTSHLNPIVGDGSLSPFLNWLSYVPTSLIQLFAERHALRSLQPGAGSLLRHYFGPWLWQFPSVMSYSQQLWPVLGEDMPAWYEHTGPLLPLAQETTQPVPTELQAFIDEGQQTPLLYVGFGSYSLAHFLSPDRARRAALDILDAIDALGIRAILLEHTFDFMLDHPRLRDPRLFIGRSFPHSWLLPRVSVIVHQAGAGHCTASARSGTPTIAIPIFEEQELNARKLAQAGAAVRLSINELTAASFQQAFVEALGLAEQARVLGERVEREVQSSGGAALAAMQRWLAGSDQA